MSSESSDENADDYWLTYTIRKPLVDSTDPTYYTSDIDGVLTLGDTETEHPEKIGEITARLVHIDRAENDGLSILDVFDCEDQELYEYYPLFIDEETGRVKEKLSECPEPNLLIIRAVEILPEHRGRRLGLFAVLQTIKEFGGSCAAVATYVEPILYRNESTGAWASRMATGQRDVSTKTACDALGRYLRLLGFKRVGRTRYYVLDLAFKLPNLADLGH